MWRGYLFQAGEVKARVSRARSVRVGNQGETRSQTAIYQVLLWGRWDGQLETDKSQLKSSHNRSTAEFIIIKNIDL